MIAHADLARMCQQSYDSIEDAIAVEGDDGNKCWVDHWPDHVFIVFRGTADLAGWLEDIDAALIPHFGMGRVHRGFARGWESLRGQVMHLTQGERVILTGHSLGGALATLAAADFGDRVIDIATFGCPRVGDREFATNYRGLVGPIGARYVNGLDPVPLLPGLLMGYRHVQPAKRFDGEGWQDNPTLADRLTIAWRFATRLAQGQVCFAHNLLRDWWGYHSIARYVEALA